jgi:hypothetical protein
MDGLAVAMTNKPASILARWTLSQILAYIVSSRLAVLPTFKIDRELYSSNDAKVAFHASAL